MLQPWLDKFKPKNDAESATAAHPVPTARHGGAYAGEYAVLTRLCARIGPRCRVERPPKASIELPSRKSGRLAMKVVAVASTPTVWHAHPPVGTPTATLPHCHTRATSSKPTRPASSELLAWKTAWVQLRHLACEGTKMDRPALLWTSHSMASASNQRG